ncbi:MAG: septum formation initiator family protein [Lachnospiraceae bacterium]|nr:septum formation initiator family protein [Lachnospiraceae bacterium]
MARRAAFRNKKSKNGGSWLFLVLLLFLFFGLGQGIGTLKKKGDALEERRVALEQEMSEQQAYSEELKELRKYTKTKKYAEEVAKERLGLVYEDEIVFKPQE